jgi:hypothetical protein
VPAWRRKRRRRRRRARKERCRAQMAGILAPYLAAM